MGILVYPGRQINWSHPLAQGLVDIWLFNDGARWASLRGIAGNSGVANPPSWSGRHGGSLEFADTTVRYISTPDRDEYDPGGNDWSIVVWFSTTLVPGGNASMLVAKRNSGATTNPGWQVFISGTPGFVAWAFCDGSASRIRSDTTAPAISDGVLHQTAVTFRRTETGLVYVDGRLASGGNASISAQQGSINSTETLRFGNDGQGSFSAQQLAGNIAYISLYRRVLTPEEVQRLYTNPYGMFDRHQLIVSRPPSITVSASTFASFITSVTDSTPQTYNETPNASITLDPSSQIPEIYVETPLATINVPCTATLSVLETVITAFVISLTERNRQTSRDRTTTVSTFIHSIGAVTTPTTSFLLFAYTSDEWIPSGPYTPTTGAAFVLLATDKTVQAHITSTDFSFVLNASYKRILNIFTDSNWISAALLGLDELTTPSWVWTTFADVVQNTPRPRIRTGGAKQEIILLR